MACPPDTKGFSFVCPMKYNILINQKAVIDAGFDLDIVDLAIFELLKDFALTKECKKMISDDVTYFLFNWKLVNAQLPILGLNTRQSVFKRFEKLRACNIIVPHSDNTTLQKSWYTFGPSYDLMLFKRPDNESLHGESLGNTPDNESLREPDNNGLHNNPISNNTIKDKIDSIRQKKIDFVLKLLSWVEHNPRKYPKLMYIAFTKHWIELKKNGKKIRYDDEQFFEMGKRLSFWFSRASDKEIATAWEAEEKIAPLNTLLRSLF